MELRHRAMADACGVASVGSIALSVWRGRPTHADAVLAVDLLQRLTREHRSIALLAVLTDGCRPPSPRVMRTISSGVRGTFFQISAVAHVVEGDRFQARGLRACLRIMSTMVGRDGLVLDTSGDARTGATFLACQHPVRVGQLVEAVDALRAGLTTHSSLGAS